MFAILDDDELCLVAYCKLEGETNRQIAQIIEKSVPTVERKLNLIRRLWSGEAGGSQQ